MEREVRRENCDSAETMWNLNVLDETERAKVTNGTTASHP